MMTAWHDRHKLILILSCLLLVGLLSAGLARLTQTADYRVYFDAGDPDLNASEKLAADYTPSDNILMVLEPRGSDMFTAEHLDSLRDLTERAWMIPLVQRVDSLTNFPYMVADGDEVSINPLYGTRHAPLTAADIDHIRDIALGEPELVNRLVSGDGKVAAVNITVRFPAGEVDRKTREVVAAVRALAADFEQAHGDIKVHLTGIVMMNNAFPEVSEQDSARLFPIMLAVIVLAIQYLFRSTKITLAVVVVMILSIMSGVGFAGWLGLRLNPVTGATPVIILTVAIAACVHVLSGFRHHYLSQGTSQVDAMARAVQQNARPVMLTSLSSALGFLSMNFSESPPFRQLGTISAVGIMMVCLLSLTFLPALINSLRIKQPAQDQATGRLNAFLAFLVNQVIRRPLAVFLVMASLSAILVFSATRNELNEDFVRYFDKSFDVRNSTEFAIDHLTGIGVIEYDFPAVNGVTDPAYLNQLEKIGNWFTSQPEVRHVESFANTMKRINRSMHGGDSHYDRIEQDAVLNSQYLFLYENSLPLGYDVSNRLRFDKQASRLSVTTGDITNNQLLALEQRASDWLAQNAGPELQVPGLGWSMMFGKVAAKNIKSMLVATLLAVLVVSLFLIVPFRSVRIGLVSLIPNVIPALAALGIWALTVGTVGLAASIVTAMTFGIVVDDSIHILDRYLKGRQRGLDGEQAVRQAIVNVGKPVIYTSLLLMAGFLCLAFSGFRINSTIGWLSCMTIAVALVFDLLMLPALLLLVDRHRSRTQVAIIDGDRLAGTNSGLVPGGVGLLMMSGLLLISWAALYTAPVQAASDSQARGLEIATRLDQSDRGYRDVEADVTMRLYSAQGQSFERTLRVYQLENHADGDKSKMIFESPNDQKGVALLTYSHPGAIDDQWLYLPALKRAKKIAAQNKSGPFVGSEFAFEDMVPQELDQYTYELVSTDACGDYQCAQVYRFPRDPDSGYSKQEVWVNTDLWRVEKVEFYDRAGLLMKTLSFDGYQLFNGRHWRPASMRMDNHQSGRATEMDWRDYRFSVGQSDSDFSVNRLKLGR